MKLERSYKSQQNKILHTLRSLIFLNFLLLFSFRTCNIVVNTFRSCSLKYIHIYNNKIKFSSAIRQMPGDLCTAPSIISLLPLSLATYVTLGASDHWLGTRTGDCGTATLTGSFFFFGRSP